jgi:hypothetical protein
MTVTPQKLHMPNAEKVYVFLRIVGILLVAQDMEALLEYPNDVFIAEKNCIWIRDIAWRTEPIHSVKHQRFKLRLLTSAQVR